MIGVYIATEDPLSEAVAECLIREENQGMQISVKMGGKGNGYLRKKFLSLNKLARSCPVVLFTDLDRVECPSVLIEDWCGRSVLQENMLFRVVVRETEAWLLADRNGFSEFSGIPVDRIAAQPESLDDPKAFLLEIVKRYSRKRAFKADILPERGSTAKVGLGYNQALCRFVQETWSIDKASSVAVSLSRARNRIHELNLRLRDKG